jgi:serine/threonine protein kinase
MNKQYSGQEIDGFLVQEAVDERLDTVIYRAVQVSLKRFVSFKTMPLPDDPKERDLFLREFNLQLERIISLEHTHLLPIYASGQIGREATYIVSRLLPGTLDALLRVGSLPLDVALPVARQIGDALTYLHGRGFVHGSLSPKVVYVTTENMIYMNDLEMSLVVEKAPSMDFLQQVLGGLHYLPPEQLRLQALDFRADVYSFGATLYDLVTGEPPFRKGMTNAALLDLKLSNTLRPPSTFNPSISPELEAIIMRALRADPAERFQSGQEMTQALYALDGYANWWTGLRVGENPLARIAHNVQRFLRSL